MDQCSQYIKHYSKTNVIASVYIIGGLRTNTVVQHLMNSNIIVDKFDWSISYNIVTMKIHN